MIDMCNGENLNNILPRLGFGTYKLGDIVDSYNLISSAIHQGYRLIDTAQVYGTEEVVGRVIKETHIDRSDLFIITKVWFTNYGEGKTYDSVIQSMRNIGTSCLDMVLLHWPFGDYYGAWRDLEKLYKEKKARFIGVSNFSADRLIDLINFNKIMPMANEIETNIFCQQQQLRMWMKKYDIMHIAYSPLGQGKNNALFEQDSVRMLAKKYEKSYAQIMIKYIQQLGCSVISKSCDPQHITENFLIDDFELSKDDMQILKSLDRASPIIGLSNDPVNIENCLHWGRH